MSGKLPVLLLGMQAKCSRIEFRGVGFHHASACLQGPEGLLLDVHSKQTQCPPNWVRFTVRVGEELLA